MQPDANQPLSDKGHKETEEVAGGLLGAVTEMSGGLRIGRIYHGSYGHVAETAKIFKRYLGAAGDGPELKALAEFLNPESFGPYEKLDLQRKLRDTLEGELPAAGSAPSPEKANAVMVVGHQPFIGWLAYEFLGRPLAITKSEVACLRRLPPRLDQPEPLQLDDRPQWQLWWTIEPTDSEMTKALTEKIKSKMDLAKILGGFITLLFGWVFKEAQDAAALAAFHWTQQVAFYAAGLLLLAAIGLYLATMYAYDRLLMPSRYWAEKPAALDERPDWLPWRPPGSTNRVLYANMLRVWNRLFTPATALALLGLFTYAFAIFPAGAQAGLIWLWLAGLVVVLAAILWLYLHNRPVLGTDD